MSKVLVVYLPIILLSLYTIGYTASQEKVTTSDHPMRTEEVMRTGEDSPLEKVAHNNLEKPTIRKIRFWPKRLEHVQLRPTRPILSDEDVTKVNAFFYIREFMHIEEKDSPERIPKADKEMDIFWYLGCKGQKYPHLDEWLERNARIIALCEKGARLEKCQMVTTGSVETSIRPSLNSVRGIFRELRYRAEREAQRGNWNHVLDDWRTMLRLSDHLTRGGSLVDCLVSYACTGMTFAGMRRVALEYEIPPEVLKKVISLIDEIRANLEPLAETMRYEYLFGQNRVEMVYSVVYEGLSKEMGVSLDHARTLTSFGLTLVLGSSQKTTSRNFDALYSHIIDIVSGPYLPQRFNEEIMSLVEEENYEYWRVRVAGDILGRIIARMVIPALDRAHAAYLRNIARLECTKLVLAIRWYQQEHGGKLPPKLADLVPEYIAEVPKDPFDPGNELRYAIRDDAWVVYSIDANQVDDGGLYNFHSSSDKEEHEDKLDFYFSSDEFDRRREEHFERVKKKSKK